MDTQSRAPELKIGKKGFRCQGKTYVMGILNVTPDSFFDGGKWDGLDRALYRVESMLREGMDVLDIGGESTRPGYTPVSDEEEIARVAPAIEAVKERFDVPVSLDTGKSSVALAGIEAGADMINDIWGLRRDPLLADVIAGKAIPCCIVHNREQVCEGDILQIVEEGLQESIRLAAEAGITKERILLDPGIGFGKSTEQNLSLINRLERLRELGYPILLGCSRKSVIGATLDLPADERLEGTLATTVIAVMKGCMFVRVHDVQENVRAIRMAEAILASRV